MNAKCKSQLGMAVAAALSAACMAPATSYGWSVDTQAGTLVNDSAGDTLLLPIFTTAVGAKTSFSTTNTGDQTIVTKIRFREQVHSMDVLDFLVIYSPEDKFDFWVDQGEEDERPTMRWTDNSCVVGPAAGGVQPFPPPTKFVASSEQMSVGHVEIIGMVAIDGVCVDSNGANALYVGSGSCPSSGANKDLAAAAKHNSSGVPADCDLLTKVFASPTNVAALNTALSSSSAGEVDNDLVGRYVITGADAGIEGGSDAVAIKDSNLGPGSIFWRGATAQSSASCVNCVPSYEWDKLEWDHPHLAEMASLAGFQVALRATSVIGDWSNNPANFVGVDWVLSFPIKYAYLDYVLANTCEGGSSSSSAREWCLLYETETGYGGSGIWTTDRSPTYEGTADLCLKGNTQYIYDVEEQAASTNVQVSPGSNPQLDICNELNVMTLAAIGDEVRDSIIQTMDRRQIVRFENLDALRGWGELELSWPTPMSPASRGDALTGLIFTTRATGDPNANNGSITELQKRSSK